MCYLLGVLDGSTRAGSTTIRISAFGENRDPGLYEQDEHQLPLPREGHGLLVSVTLPKRINDIHAITISWGRRIDEASLSRALGRIPNYVTNIVSDELSAKARERQWTQAVNPLVKALLNAQHHLYEVADGPPDIERRVELIPPKRSPAWLTRYRPRPFLDEDDSLANYRALEPPDWFTDLADRSTSTFISGALTVTRLAAQNLPPPVIVEITMRTIVSVGRRQESAETLRPED